MPYKMLLRYGDIRWNNLMASPNKRAEIYILFFGIQMNVTPVMITDYACHSRLGPISRPKH